MNILLGEHLEFILISSDLAINYEMNRILIFSHYHPQNGLSKHVLFTLSQLRPYYARVLFVSNSALSIEQLNAVRQYADKTICRENKGFDFGAWKDVILSEGWENLVLYDSLTLMNDTCFGPMFSMGEVFDIMEKSGVDFWGLTNHRRLRRDFIHTCTEIPEHIQSYFFVFNQKVINSLQFKHFWDGVSYYSNVQPVIKQYEVRLTRYLQRAGFSWSTLLNTCVLNNSCPNMATMHPDVMLRSGVPFIKIKGLLNTQNPSYLMRMIEKNTNYNTRLIIDHFRDIYSPNEQVKVTKKHIILGKADNIQKTGLSVAIHIHAYYIDVLKKFLSSINRVSSDINLFITTDTDSKKNEILKEVERLEKVINQIEVLVMENRGRNVWSWLSLQEKLRKFDLVGHFHTKKTIWSDDWFGSSWFEEIMMVMVEQADELFGQFERNKNIGIVIPDIPYGIKMVDGFDGWAGNRDLFNEFWKKMNRKKNIDAYNIISPIMPYGTMFWYRPKALQPLFDLKLSASDFPPEPIPIDATLAHAIERLPVYIAWSQGYDFLIASNEETLNTGFDYMERSSKHLKEAVYETYTWRIGRAITWLPRMIRDMLKR